MERALRGQQALVGVVGASGIGKSALVERFLHETTALAPGAVLLVGKCYEHEYVPFKALDGVIDAAAAASCAVRLPTKSRSSFLRTSSSSSERSRS